MNSILWLMFKFMIILGKVLYEGQLEDFYTEEKISPLVYKKGTGCLYLLGMTSSELGVKYVIYKYQIKL